MWIMRKVGQHAVIPEMEEIQPARCLCGRGDKRAECGPDILDRDIAEQVSGQHGRQAVLHIMYRFPLKRQWDIFYRHHPDLPGAFHYADVSVFKYSSQTSFRAMFFDPWIIFIHAEKSNVAVKSF